MKIDHSRFLSQITMKITDANGAQLFGFTAHDLLEAPNHVMTLGLSPKWCEKCHNAMNNRYVVIQYHPIKVELLWTRLLARMSLWLIGLKPAPATAIFSRASRKAWLKRKRQNL